MGIPFQCELCSISNIEGGILWRISKRVVTAAIIEGHIVFLVRDATTQEITHNAHTEGEV